MYYDDPNSRSCTATIVNVNRNSIELDQTVAYPEGGGQESDHGVIQVTGAAGESINFIDTQLSLTSLLLVDNFPDIKIDGVILHIVADEDIDKLAQFHVGDEVTVTLDSERRQALTQSHTATHLMYLAVDEIQKNVVNNTIGCHIKPDSGRLDFSTDHKFNPEDVKRIEAISNVLIDQQLTITIASREEAPEARYWECDGRVIPCGGMHTDNTREVPYIKVSRKNIGKGKERIQFRFQEAA